MSDWAHAIYYNIFNYIYLPDLSDISPCNVWSLVATWRPWQESCRGTIHAKTAPNGSWPVATHCLRKSAVYPVTNHFEDALQHSSILFNNEMSRHPVVRPMSAVASSAVERPQQCGNLTGLSLRPKVFHWTSKTSWPFNKMRTTNPPAQKLPRHFFLA